MNTLVPLDTANPTLPYVISQQLAPGVTSVTIDISQFNFAAAPGVIVPLVGRVNSTVTIGTTSPTWTATSFSCNLSQQTPDGSFVCSLQILL